MGCYRYELDAGTRYVHNDHHNTPQVVTNQSKQVVFMADYQPFGKLNPGQTNSIELYSRFPGQYLDSETGTYYNYFRDYDPSIGRYIESDPIGLEGGINSYSYTLGNPIKYIDPEGKSIVLEGGIIIGGGILVGGLIWAATHRADKKGTDSGTYCPPKDDPCEAEEREAKEYCTKLYDDGYEPDPLGKGIGGKNWSQCVKGRMTEACGGNRVEW